MPSSEDLELAERVAAREEQAVALLYQRYRRQVEDRARLAGVPPDLAEDLAHVTLIAAVEAIENKRFRRASSVRTFLIGILRNKVLITYGRKPALPSRTPAQAIPRLNRLQLSRLRVWRTSSAGPWFEKPSISCRPSTA